MKFFIFNMSSVLWAIEPTPSKPLVFDCFKSEVAGCVSETILTEQTNYSILIVPFKCRILLLAPTEAV